LSLGQSGPHTLAVSWHDKSQFAGGAKFAGEGAGVTLEAGAELKENAAAGVGVEEEGTLRSMILKLDAEAADGVCALMLAGEADEAAGRKKGDGAAGDDARGELRAGWGVKAGGVEHAASVTVKVTVESKRTVARPFAPVVVNSDGPFDATGFGTGVNAGLGDDDETTPPRLKLDDEKVVGALGEKGNAKGVVVVGTIPPELNVLAEDADSNCRLFRWMTGGKSPPTGALRLMIEGLAKACGEAA
jgi:hypothetical protein